LLAARRTRAIHAGFACNFAFQFKVFPPHSGGVLAFVFEVSQFMQIMVRDNNVDQALRALKKKLQREGVYREMKLRRHFEKPSEKRAREKAAAVRRARKMDRKRMERDGIK
jgi:small subunit ribosomal protein S21